MNSDKRPDQRDTCLNPSDYGENDVLTLRGQLKDLAEEKNTLLDYINENIDKFGSLSKKKNSGQSDSNSELVIELKTKINVLENQNESLVRQQYQSPDFGHQSSDTFGNQDQFQKHFQDAKSQFLKEKETLSTHLN